VLPTLHLPEEGRDVTRKTRREAIAEAVKNEPQDRTARSALADVLEEEGDEKGALIQRAILSLRATVEGRLALARQSHTDALKEYERAIRQALRDRGKSEPAFAAVWDVVAATASVGEKGEVSFPDGTVSLAKAAALAGAPHESTSNGTPLSLRMLGDWPRSVDHFDGMAIHTTYFDGSPGRASIRETENELAAAMRAFEAVADLDQA
jgi:uncharacterized protein (TIGR02996 family)